LRQTAQPYIGYNNRQQSATQGSNDTHTATQDSNNQV